jgi:hypothetical protein
LRWLVWGGIAVLLALPLVAMQFSDEVQWTAADFIVMGGMLGLVGGAYELVVRVARNNAYVAAAGIAVASAFLMTWINLAVGIIGTEDNPANQMFFGVLLVGFIAAACSRLKPLGMARAMEITAAVQVLVSLITFAMGEGYIFVLTGFFVALWLVSAQLFRKSARDEADSAGVASAA